MTFQNSLHCRIRFLARCAAIKMCSFMILLSVATPAAQATKYSCSPDEIKDAAKAVYETTPKHCLAHKGNPYYWGLTIFLIAATQTPQGKKFCNYVQDAKTEIDSLQNKLIDYKSKFADIWGQLDEEQQKEIKDKVPKDVFSLGDDAASAASDGYNALSLLSCACTTAQWEEPVELASEFGQCAAAGMCWLQDKAHELLPGDSLPCSKQPPQPPKQIDCTVDPVGKSSTGGYTLSGAYVGHYDYCQAAGFECVGDLCYALDLIKKPTNNYTGSNAFCYCPAHMRQKGWFYQDSTSHCVNYLNCACPAGSKPLSQTGAGKYTCMCDSTGMPIGASGKCPAKLACNCPQGEKILSVDYDTGKCTCGCSDGQFKLGNKCVSACANQSHVMLAGGACCAPGNATTCGNCCPAGTKRSADGTTCETFSLAQAAKPKGLPNASLVPTKPINY